jgi:hypothetical protein
VVYEPPVIEDVVDVGESDDDALPSFHLPRQSLVNMVEDDDAVEEEEQSVSDVKLPTLPSFYSSNHLEVKHTPAESPSLVALCDLLASMAFSTHTHALQSDSTRVAAESVINPLTPTIVVSADDNDEDKESVPHVELPMLLSFYSSNHLEVKHTPAESPSLVALCDLLASMTVSTHTHAPPFDHAGVAAESVIAPLTPMIVLSDSSSFHILKLVEAAADYGSQLAPEDDYIRVSASHTWSMLVRVTV